MNPVGDDQVIELTSMPPPDPGAPIPLLFADEHHLVVAYYASARIEPWVTTFDKAPVIGLSEENVAAVRFDRCYSHMFGPPNDEAFSGHRLYDKGLRPYSFCEVRHSSCIRGLERMNTPTTIQECSIYTGTSSLRSTIPRWNASQWTANLKLSGASRTSPWRDLCGKTSYEPTRRRPFGAPPD